jgi:hypothetical protein
VSPSTSAPDAPPDLGEVRLKIPAASRYLRLARLMASGFVVDLDFGMDDVEALRVAVDELAAAVIDGCHDTDVLDLSFKVVDGAAIVEGSCRTDAGPLGELHAVARSLLDLLADDYTLADGNGEGPLAMGARHFWLCKRSSHARR